ncbi:MAG: DUF4270 domain-containing protein [Muribaculum sp.]|nr:DUF4270 domain-containing protein [Muribaculum sp.]
MNCKLITGTFAAAVFASALFSSCEDDLSPIGEGLRPTDVTINVDSTAFNLNGKTVEALSIDSRSTTTMLGSINVADYGRLNCSYVTQLLPASDVSIPDSIAPTDIDSVRLILRIPMSTITGDTLSPQQLTVYRLKDQLPADINSSYDPEGKYYPTPLGKRNYTLSGIALGNGEISGTSKNRGISLRVTLPRELGVDALQRYRTNPDIFQWPEEFAKVFPGLYVKSSFGKGCIASISSSEVYVYTHHKAYTSVPGENGSYTTVLKEIRDSTCFFTSAPEVLSSNIISYTPSEIIHNLALSADPVVTSPGGYNARITFPARELLKTFREKDVNLSVINNLTFFIPAHKVDNQLGIGVPPKLLMVKTSEADAFFSEGKVPDDKTSFVCTFSETDSSYKFGSLRSYIVALNEKEEITEDDCDFMLIPVQTETESVTQSDGTVTEYYTGCVPYMAKPTMCRLFTDRAVIVFTYSNQTLY